MEEQFEMTRHRKESRYREWAQAILVISSILGSIVPVSELVAQTGGGILRATIVNGTTGGPGRAEQVTLFDLSSGMTPVATLDDVSNSFTLEQLDVDVHKSYLLQVTSGGVKYSGPVKLGAGYEAEATVTVYDVTREWDSIQISKAQFVLQRRQDRLKVDKLYLVENNSEPKKTLYDPAGTFRFLLPSNLAEMRPVSARSSSGGMPVPQHVSPLADGSGHTSQTAFKPGVTQIAISYNVDYSSERYNFQEKTFYALPEVMVLITPTDIELDATGWESFGDEAGGHFIALRQANIPAGSSIELALSGGSNKEAPSPHSSSRPIPHTSEDTALLDSNRRKK
jgi:hypothetical protein